MSICDRHAIRVVRIEVAQELERDLERALDREYREYERMLSIRGVENACPECDGYGVLTYGDTSTWRRGAGGQMLTTDVCDKCWGSGDIDKPWPSWREQCSKQK